MVAAINACFMHCKSKTFWDYILLLSSIVLKVPLKKQLRKEQQQHITTWHLCAMSYEMSCENISKRQAK